jgi:hypothetical protein
LFKSFRECEASHDSFLFIKRRNTLIFGTAKARTGGPPGGGLRERNR